MSKVTVALGSFTLGVLIMFLFGNHTSIFVQSASAQKMIALAGEPTIPPLHGTISSVVIENFTQPLDGLDCKDCVFKNVTFEYSGGAYKLVNAHISTPMHVVLKGAAANTVGLLAFVESLNASTKPKPLQPNAPLFRTAENTQTITVDFISPYGQP